MFTRIEKSGRHQYLQVVENRREDGKTRQRVPGTLGRLDRLRKSGALDGLVRSLAVFSERSIALSSARRRSAAGAAEPGDGMPTRQIGPALVFDRLWEESGCREVIAGLTAGRRHGFDLERVIFFSVLHTVSLWEMRLKCAARDSVGRRKSPHRPEQVMRMLNDLDSRSVSDPGP